MRAQSKKYDPYRAVRHVGIRAEIAVIDADAKPNASASSAFTMPLTSTEQTVDENKENPQTFATLERNTWLLDGSCAMMDETAEALGWWSSVLSDDNGNIAGECNITYTFSVDAKTIGLVFFFAPGYQPAIGGMRIRAYDSNGDLVADVMNTEQSETQTVVFSAIYRRLQIDFTKTVLPGRRVRMTEIDFGVTQVYDDDSIVSAEIRYKTDLSATNLPYGQCSIKVDNADHRYNLLNPEGIYQYLERGQKVSVWVTIDGESVYMGSWEFSEASAKDGALTAQITAVDMIASLDDDEYNGGRCAAAVFSDAVMEVLDGTGIECVFEGDIADSPVMMCVPSNTTKREAVRLLTQAAMGCAFADREGKLHFARMKEPIALVSDDGYVLEDNQGIVLMVSSVDSAELTPNELYNYDGITVTETIGKIKLVVNDSFSGTETEYTAGDGGKTKIVKNPCISSENGNDVAKWMLERMGRKKNYHVKNRCDPAAELLDHIRIYDAYDQREPAVITGTTIHYNGGLSAETEAIG